MKKEEEVKIIINNLLKEVEDLKSKELEDKANSIINETLNQNRAKDNNSFSFLDTDNIKEEHKIVSQLDEVTKESELKASAIFDIMNEVSDDLLKLSDTYVNTENFLNELLLDIKGNKKLETKIEYHLKKIKKLHNIKEHANSILFEAMSLMQYQDINRQRIERVINIIRTLSKYLNLLFEGKKDDIERTTSARHLAGDSNDVTSNEEIEELINNKDSLINSMNNEIDKK